MSTNQKWLLGVLGDPIEHSCSPAMMQAAFASLHLSGRYDAYRVTSGQLGHAVRGLVALGFTGCNVTIPHKEAVCAYMDVVDETALRVGAVNTVVVREGKLYGYNTDGRGYVRSLCAEVDAPLHQRDVLILGAGGAAKGIVHAVVEQLSPRSLTIANRTQERAMVLAAQVPGVCHTLPWEAVQEAVSAYGLIINTTSIGMGESFAEQPCCLRHVRPGTIVSDIVYRPAVTPWLLEAERRGALIHGGIGMLVHQGALALQLWLEARGCTHTPPVATMRDAVLRAVTL